MWPKLVHTSIIRPMGPVELATDRFDSYADLDSNGIDLGRLRRNLARSLEERIERNRRVAITILECRHAAGYARLRKPNPLT